MNKCAGYIGFKMLDEANGLVLDLGGGGFKTEERLQQEWNAISAFSGSTQFLADLEDAEGCIINDKPVSAEVIEARTGQPIGTLIAEGRAKALQENAAY